LGFQNWGKNHKERVECTATGVLEFNPDLYPGQGLEDNYIETEVPNFDDHGVIRAIGLKVIQRKLGNELGSQATAKSLLRDLRHRPSSPENNQSLTKVIPEMLAEGKSVAFVVPHFLMNDLGLVMVAYTTASGNFETAKTNQMVTNKTVSFESKEVGKKTKPVPSILRPFGNQLLIVPATDSTKGYDIDADVATSINRGSMQKLTRFIRDGSTIFIAPSGSLGKTEMDAEGNIIKMIFPKFPSQSLSMLSRVDAIASVTLFKNYKTGVTTHDVGDLKLVKEIVTSKQQSPGEIQDYLKSIFTINLQKLVGEVPIEFL